MYVRMLNFQTDAGNKAEALEIMDTMIPVIKSQKGCSDCMFIMNETDGRYALLVMWETKENADAAAGVIGPRMLPALNKISKKPVSPLLYEVYQPKSMALKN
jgi:hypothetical protein